MFSNYGIHKPHNYAYQIILSIYWKYFTLQDYGAPQKVAYTRYSYS